MVALRDMWPLADGIAEPAQDSFAEMLGSPNWHLYVGCIEGVPVGFLASRDEDLLPQAEGMITAVVRLIFSEEEARRVGVGEAMMAAFLADAADRGLDRFDAYVSPGHRHAKNFYESNGFRARSIVMHRGDR